MVFGFIPTRFCTRNLNSAFVLSCLLCCMLTKPVNAQGINDGADIAIVKSDQSAESLVTVVQSPGDTSINWAQPIGVSSQSKFLFGNFNGAGADDIAAIFFDPNGDSLALITESPGHVSGLPWTLPLASGIVSEYLSGDFDNDGISDIAAIYADTPGTADSIRAKITYGPTGARQAVWNDIGTGIHAAFQGADANGDGIDDIIGIYVTQSGELRARIALGPNGAQAPSEWTLAPASVLTQIGTFSAALTGDYNKDGSFDAALIYMDAQGNARARILNGPQGATNPADWTLGSGLASFFLSADFNNDGFYDIAKIIVDTDPLTGNPQGLSKAMLYLGPAGTAVLTWNLGLGVVSTFLSGNFAPSAIPPTPLPTATPTATNTPTATFTSTPTATFTSTPTGTPTASPTAISTFTPVPPATPTFTPTPPQCKPGEIVDSCGVCNGNGTSCHCSRFIDNSAALNDMDNASLKLRDATLRALRTSARLLKENGKFTESRREKLGRLTREGRATDLKNRELISARPWE